MNEVAAYSRLAGVYDELVVDPCFASWADFLDGLWALDAEKVTTVLDVCCGTGLMARELLARGYRVTGLDASADMLQRARTVLGPDVPLLHQALPGLELSGLFDAVISTYDGLNYLTPADLRSSLAGLARHLRPGGWLVFDLHAEAMFRLAQGNPRVELDWRGTSVVIDYDVDAAHRTCTSTITMSDAEGTFVESHPQFIHEDATVRDALTAAGCERVAILDNYRMRAASDATLRATWVARTGIDPLVPCSEGAQGD